jgi:hypothetical protein
VEKRNPSHVTGGRRYGEDARKPSKTSVESTDKKPRAEAYGKKTAFVYPRACEEFCLRCARPDMGITAIFVRETDANAQFFYLE